MLEKEVRSINHSDLTSQDAPAPETPASAEQTTVLPAATASFAPVVRPAGGPVATKDRKRHSRDRLIVRRMLRIARGWGSHGGPAKPVQVSMSIPDLLGSLGLAMLSSQLPTSDIERQLGEIARAYGRPDLRMVVLPTAILVEDPAQTHTGVFPLVSAPYRLDQAGAMEKLVVRVINEHPEPAEAIREITRIEQTPARFNRPTMILGHTILTLGFGMVINPTATAIPVYLVLGAFVGLMITFTRGRTSVQLLLPVLTSFVLTLITLLVLDGLVPDDPLRLVAPALLAFLPGHMLTVAAVELASNQVIAGASRLVYGFAQLGLLAFGVYVAWVIVNAPEPVGIAPTLGPWAPWAGVVLTSIGFNLYSVAPKGALRWILFANVIVYAAQVLGSLLVGAALSGFAGAMVLEPVARAVQRFGSAPPSVVLRTSGYFLLVPGALGFIGVSEAASQTGSLGLIVQVFISLLAIALGTLVGASLSREVRAAVHTWRYAA